MTSTKAKIFAAPAGLVAAGQPQANGIMWLLSRVGGIADVTPLNLATGKSGGAVPVSSAADSLTELSTATVVVGTATASTGSLELLNGTSGSVSNTIAMSDPVKAVAPGADGTTVYALETAPSAEAIAVVNTSSGKVTTSIPVSSGTVGVVGSVDGSSVYGVQSNGLIAQYAVAGGKPMARFGIGHSGIAAAISPTGSTLYVLKSNGISFNVAVVDLATEKDVTALPAPNNSVGLVISQDASTLYALVGTPAVGNVQSFSLSG